MSKGIIGAQFTFTVLFRDPSGTQFDPPDPTIEVFYFDDSGEKAYIVPIGTAMNPVVPAETGRFSYTLTIPGSLDPRFVLYGVMRGTYPAASYPIAVEQQVDLFFLEDGTGTECGMTASFVKDGICWR